MNPYETLDVPKTASKDAIRKAYRRRARQTHPDVGGDEKQFALVKLAHDVLTDDARRERFDRTGDVEETTPDNQASEMVFLLSKAFAFVAGELMKAQVSLKNRDLVEGMRIWLQSHQAKVAEECAALEKGVKEMESVLGRFSHAEDDGTLEKLVKFNLDQTRGRLGVMKRTVESCGDGIQYLLKTKYRFEPEAVRRATWGGMPFTYSSCTWESP